MNYDKEILVLEEMKKEWKEAKQSRLNAGNYGEGLTKDLARDNKYIAALTIAIQDKKALKETSDELPEAKPTGGSSGSIYTWNAYRTLAVPILAKKNMIIAELKEKLNSGKK
ncbi:hypothetical protein LCGC14_2182790 [marine sediment metagenome]|uniref:Uncharacterized protein n=1 Tax=marine sediment metagenome TaxID=412755 RepID=A0A0F9FZ81_9ZZZZ